MSFVFSPVTEIIIFFSYFIKEPTPGASLVLLNGPITEWYVAVFPFYLFPKTRCGDIHTRYKPTTVSEHFLTNDHFANDIILIPLELTKSNRDSVRKAREAYLIERDKTREPLGWSKMKCNTVFISCLCYHLFFYFYISNSFQSLLQRFSLANIVSYCTLFSYFQIVTPHYI